MRRDQTRRAMQDTGNNATHARLFITHLAPGATPAAVADIFKRTRETHKRLAIGGAMLFDGERFGYGIFGAVAALAAAVDAVQSDLRQTGLQLLSSIEGAIPAGWPATGWRSGWTEPDGLATLAAPAADRGSVGVGVGVDVGGGVDVFALWAQLLGASDLL